MTPEDPNHPNYFPEAENRAGGDCPSAPCSPLVELWTTSEDGFHGVGPAPKGKGFYYRKTDIRALAGMRVYICESCDSAFGTWANLGKGLQKCSDCSANSVDHQLSRKTSA